MKLIFTPPSLLLVKTTLFQSLKSLLVALFMLLVLWWWFNTPFSLVLEGTFLRWCSIIKYTDLLLPSSEILYKNDVLFINAKSAKTVVTGNIPESDLIISNRVLLDSLFRQFRQPAAGKQFIICDLTFDNITPHDTALAATIAATDNSYFPTPDSPYNTLLNQVITTKYTGPVDYDYTNQWGLLTDEFLRSSLVNSNGKKSLPLVLYEQVNHTSLTPNNGLLWQNSAAYMQTITIDETIRNYTLSASGNIYPVQEVLKALADSSSTLRKNFYTKKFIVIGDFEDDIHKTAWGDAPGSLILFNIFLSLEQQQNRITPLWLFFMIAMLTGIVHFVFYARENRRFSRVIRPLKKYTGPVIGDLTTHILLISILSILSYFCFGISVNVIAAGVLFSILNGSRRIAKHAWLRYNKRSRSLSAN